MKTKIKAQWKRELPHEIYNHPVASHILYMVIGTQKISVMSIHQDHDKTWYIDWVGGDFVHRDPEDDFLGYKTLKEAKAAAADIFKKFARAL